MFGLQAPELIAILVVVVLLFGWKRLPDAARSLGRSARVFKSEVSEMKAEDEARKRVAGESSGPSALREDNSPRTDNQSGPAA